MDGADKPLRKPLRLKDYDYSQNGCYFITFCCDKRKKLLSTVVGDADLSVPKRIELKPYGKIVQNYINSMSTTYNNVSVENYIVMPDHIHLLILIDNSGTLGSASPTISTVIKAYKRLTNKECEFNLWQRGFYDHIIRNQKEYENAWQYIEFNALKEY